MADYSFVEVMKREREILDKAGRIDGVCSGVICHKCPFNDSDNNCREQRKWEDPAAYADFVMNYDDTDWHKVAKDTPVYVRSNKDDEWSRRYFYAYHSGDKFPYGLYALGTTKWSSKGKTTFYKYCKLAEEEE